MSILSSFLKRFGVPEVHFDGGSIVDSMHAILTAHEVHAALEARGNVELTKELGDACDAYFAALDGNSELLKSAGTEGIFVALLNGAGADIAPAFNRMRDLSDQGQTWLSQPVPAPTPAVVSTPVSEPAPVAVPVVVSAPLA